MEYMILIVSLVGIVFGADFLVTGAVEGVDCYGEECLIANTVYS